jgi:Polyketide cyclase / dehydrase and lipid transport
MAKIEFTVDSDLPPDRVLAAATDFTERRPDLWPGISRRFYKVHEQGAGWCECTEGSDVAGGIWARERYEWSGNAIRGTVIDSNVFKGGTWELRAEPGESGGSRITVVNDRVPKGKGLLFAPIMLLRGKKILAGNMRKTLDIIGETPNSGDEPAA